MKVSITY